MTEVEKYGWKKNIKINILLLRILGLWPSGDETYKPGFYAVYSVVIASLFTLGHVFSQVIDIYFVRGNLASVLAIIYIVLIEIMGTLKTFYIMKNMKVLKETTINLKSEWFQPRNPDQRLLIEPSISFWKKVYVVFLVVCFATNMFWMAYPLLDSFSGGKRLPFLAWYPFDVKMSPFYEITYAFQIISVIYLSLVHINVDTVISIFNVYAGCQFDLLCDNLRNFADTKKSFSGSIDDNFIKCVSHHKQILRFIDGCIEFVEGIVFWHLIISGVAIGITMCQLTLVVPFTNEFYSLVCYGFAITIQIFMYCWFGNDVEVKSNLVSYAVFESDWTDLPQEVKNNLLFFTMNVLKPAKISAFNIFDLSLATFMRILKTAWSYFALLNQLSSGN